MGPQVTYLHIGAMKTGTTYLQDLMFANKAALTSAGVVLPGNAWYEQAFGARDILDMRGANARTRANTQGAWDKLVAEMVGTPGQKSIISMEFFGFSDVARATRVAESLPGSELHVVLTVRDATKTLPAQWQTHCRNGGTIPWPRFARQARRGARPGAPPGKLKGARVFSRTQDVSRMLSVWAQVVPPNRIHAVITPGSGQDPSLLWERFADAVGIDPALCSTPPAPQNSSLGYASAELMRRVNVILGKGGTAEHTGRLHQLALVLAKRSHLEEPVPLDLRTRRFAARWNGWMAQALESSGARIVGDVAELPTRARSQPATEQVEGVSDPAPKDVLSAASYARAELDEQTHANPAEHASDTTGGGDIEHEVTAEAKRLAEWVTGSR